MAIFDDTAWLFSHIQNSYATSDDSGKLWYFQLVNLAIEMLKHNLLLLSIILIIDVHEKTAYNTWYFYLKNGFAVS